MELCDFIVPGTGVVDSIGIGPLRIKIAPLAYRKLGKQTDSAMITSMRMAGIGDCDQTKKKLLCELRAYVADHGPVSATGHSQGGFQALRMFVEEPNLFTELVAFEAPVLGSTPALAGSWFAPGFSAMTPGSKAVKDLYCGLSQLGFAERKRLHLYATANGIFVLPHTAALCNLEGIDNVWVGQNHPFKVRTYSRHIKTTRRIGHLGMIWREEVLSDMRMIFETSMWPNIRTLIPQQRNQPPSHLRASS